MAAPPAVRALEYWLRAYRGTWRGSVFSGFLAPLLYLGSLGFGLGALVDGAGRGGLGGLTYAAFVAPGVLAATAMQTAVGESTYPVMGAIVWNRLYDAMLATPLRVVDVLLGHLAFVAARLVFVTGAFAVVAAALGVLRTPWAPVIVLIAVLGGLAYAAPVMAYSATLSTDQQFALLYRLGIIPTFLFAGTFFPVDRLPGALRAVAWATPLWHATDAARALAAGRVDAVVVLGHVAYLLAWTVGGVALARWTYTRRLVP